MTNNERGERIFVVRERNEDGEPEGWLSFHRTKEGALIEMRRVAKERCEEGDTLEESEQGGGWGITIELSTANHTSCVEWWIDERTLED